VAVAEKVDAKKIRYDAAAVKAVLKGVEEIVSMRGKQLIRLHLRKDAVTEAQIHAAILGPFGNLRAPALRKGKTLIVGFNEETYRKLFK
jgi:arsenate reductase-like glutaredoxin family protein